MENLLGYLNSSEIDALTALPGCDAGLAQKIIDARPFNSLEDSARVKEITPELLSRWQTQVETENITSDAVHDTASVEIPVESEDDSRRRSRKSRTLRILFTIFIVVLILAALAAAVYYGVPYFYKKVLNPLESNTNRVSELADIQKSDTKRLESEISILQTRIADLEARADEIDQTIATLSTNLTKLEELQTTLREDLDAQKSEILAKMGEQLVLTRSLELLARSRLYLSQSNYGLAQTDIAEARSLLYSLLTQISVDQSDGLKVVINRLDLALGNLPEYPVVAVYDVDIAWKLLVDGLPNVPAMALTPAVSVPTLPVESGSPQVTQIIEATPTP